MSKWLKVAYWGLVIFGGLSLVWVGVKWVNNQNEPTGLTILRNLGLIEIERYSPDQLRGKIDKLAVCESTDAARAINFEDRDGTASFGCLQFKPTTFRKYAIKYGYMGEKASWDWMMTKIFDCELQKQIGADMIKDKEVDKNNEWPVCWNKIK